MKYLTFIIWMLLTPIVCVGTILFIFGLVAQDWMELGDKILSDKK